MYPWKISIQRTFTYLSRNSNMLTCCMKISLKMITRLLLSACCSILLLPSLVWALDKPAATLAAQSETAIVPPEQPVQSKTAPVLEVPLKPAPAQIPPAPDSSVKPIPVPIAPAKPVPAPIAPANPAPVPMATSKPAPVPATPVKPAPAPIITTQPAPAPPASVQPAPAQKMADFPSDIASHTADIEVFMREDCPQCKKANEFLTKLKNLKPQLKINIRDVRKEPAALQLLIRMAKNQGMADLDYPAFVVGGQLIIGFSEEASTAQKILDNLAVFHPATQQAGNDPQNCKTGKEPSCGLIVSATVVKPESVIIDILGYNVPLSYIGMPLYTLAMGLLDGLNHGSTWVLILMISLLAPIKDRALMLTIAGTFIAVQGVIYFVLMSAWLNLVMLIDVSRIAQIIFASIALLAGVTYFKNYLQFGHSLAFSSHEIVKPGIYTRIRKIVQAENLATALFSTIMLAILVQFGEFSYTSIFPAVYTHVLAVQQLDSLSNYTYLLLYDFAYMLDDIVVLTIGVLTLSQGQTEERNARLLKLISGLLFAVTAAYLLLILH